MRDLNTTEVANVYGAGGSSRRGCLPCGKGSRSRKKKSSKRKRKSSRKYC